MGQEEYIQSRLDEQISWYDSKSTHHQKWYKGLK